MKLMTATLLLTAATFYCTARNLQAQEERDYAQNGQTAQPNDSTANGTERPAAARDTLQIKLYGRTIDKNSVNAPQYDVFKEKAKEPWLGGVLKDIIFH